MAEDEAVDEARFGASEGEALMAGVEIRGFEELKRNAERLGKAIAEEAVTADEDAAANVVKSAGEAAAPRKSGQLESSVRIFEGVDRKALSGSIRRRLLIGPEKRKGFYGYFVDVGWNASGKRILGTGWLTKAAAAVERQAQEAGTAAFDAVVQRLAGGNY
jgi:hypothetical protein